MKTSRYTEAQIIAILRQAEGGVPVAELCREHGMSNASFYSNRPLCTALLFRDSESLRLRLV